MIAGLALAAAVCAARPGAAAVPSPAGEKGIMTEAAERARAAFDPDACLVGAEVLSGFEYSDADHLDERRLTTYRGSFFTFWFRSDKRQGYHSQRFCSPVGDAPPPGGLGPKTCFGGFGEWWSDDEPFAGTRCIRSAAVPIAEALESGVRKGLKGDSQGLRARLRFIDQVPPRKKRLGSLKGQLVWLLRGDGDRCLAIHALSRKQLFWGSCEGIPW